MRPFQPSIYLSTCLWTKCQRSCISITTVFGKLSLTWTLNLHPIPNSILDLLLRVTDSVTKIIWILDSDKACLMNCIIYFLCMFCFLIIYQVLNIYQPLSLKGDLYLSSDFLLFLFIKRELSSQTISSLPCFITCYYP